MRLGQYYRTLINARGAPTSYEEVDHVTQDELDEAVADGVYVLAGDVTGVPTSTVIAPGVIDNTHVAADAAIAASKLDLSGYQTRVDRLVIGSGNLTPMFGAPTFGQIGVSGIGIAVAFLGDGAYSIGTIVQLPAHWLTYKLSVRWTKSSGTAANVLLYGAWGRHGDGDSLGGTLGSNQVVATPANNVVRTTQLGTNITADPTKQELVTLTRLGTDASDTFTGTVCVLSLLLERVT